MPKFGKGSKGSKAGKDNGRKKTTVSQPETEKADGDGA